MTDKPKSDRQLLAEEIYQFVLDNDLDQVFGSGPRQSGDKKYYAMTLSLPRTLDGEIKVYSPKFIQVRAAGPLAQAGSNRVFESKQNVLDYLRLAFVEFNFDAAASVPTKPEKPSR